MISLRSHRRLIEAWHSESGETIVETLVSVLISSLALLMLATAIGTAVNVVTTTKTHMETYYKTESNVIAQLPDNSKGAKTSMTVSIPLRPKDIGPAGISPIGVKVYTDAASSDSIALYNFYEVTP